MKNSISYEKEIIKYKNILLTEVLNVCDLSRVYPKAKEDNIYHFKNH